MSIYIPFNFRPVESKIIGTPTNNLIDASASSYSPPAGRYAHITGLGGVVSYSGNFINDAIGLSNVPLGPNKIVGNLATVSLNFSFAPGFFAIRTFQPNGLPMNNFTVTELLNNFYTIAQTIPTSIVGGATTSAWIQSNDKTATQVNFTNPNNTDLNVQLQWFFVPYQSYDFWLNENQTIFNIGARLNATEYVNI